MMTNVSPTNADLAQRLEKSEERQDKHGDILVRLTTLMEVLTSRVAAIEADNRATQTALVDIGKALVRYEERDAATQRWSGLAIGISSSLIVGIVTFAIGYFIHTK